MAPSANATTFTHSSSLIVAGNLTVANATLEFGITAKTLTVTGDLLNTNGTIEMGILSSTPAHVLNLNGANNAITNYLDSIKQ